MGKKNEEKKLKKRKLHIQRTKILIRYSTHASPSNNFYLNKQSAIVSNPTYKRTTYFSRLTNWTVIPLKIEDTSARLIPPRATILLPWYLNLDRERERREFIGPACRATSVLCLQHTLHWIPNAIYRTVHLYCMTVSS